MIKTFLYSLFGMLLCGSIVTATCPDWTGIYFGAQAGGGWSSAKWTYLNSNPYSANGPGQPILGSINNFPSSGFVGGGQVGMIYQLGRFVAGLEGACDTTEFTRKKLNVVQIFAPFRQTVKTDISILAMGIGRMGYLFCPDWLVYAKGGYAGAKVKTSGRTFDPITGDPVPGFNLDWDRSKWHSGWVAGAGVEYRLYPRIILGVEYDYVSLNQLTHVGAVSGGSIGPADQVEHNVNARFQIILARLNFLVW